MSGEDEVDVDVRGPSGSVHFSRRVSHALRLEEASRETIEGSFRVMLDAAERDGRARALIFSTEPPGMRVPPDMEAPWCPTCHRRHVFRVRFREGHPEVSMDGGSYQQLAKKP